MKIYSTVDADRHWFFNKSVENILNNKISFINFNNLLFKILFKRSKVFLIIDSGLFEKLIFLILGSENVSIIIHGEAGFGSYIENWKKILYYRLFKFFIYKTKCKIIFLSHYLNENFHSNSNFYFLEHPGFYEKYSKIKISDKINSVGAISIEKNNNNYLKDIDIIAVRNNLTINHYGNFFLTLKSYKNINFNGFIDIKLNLKIFSQSKFIFLLNNSEYRNIVSGVVIQSIYNLCLIITYDKYPKIIDYYENLFDTNIHISFQDFINLKEPNIYYNSKIKNLTLLRNKLTNQSLFDSNKIFY